MKKTTIAEVIIETEEVRVIRRRDDRNRLERNQPCEELDNQKEEIDEEATDNI